MIRDGPSADQKKLCLAQNLWPGRYGSGWTLPNFPWFTFASIGGQVATGTHGSGLTFGSLADDTQLVALQVRGSVPGGKSFGGGGLSPENQASFWFGCIMMQVVLANGACPPTATYAPTTVACALPPATEPPHPPCPAFRRAARTARRLRSLLLLLT